MLPGGGRWLSGGRLVNIHLCDPSLQHLLRRRRLWRSGRRCRVLHMFVVRHHLPTQWTRHESQGMLPASCIRFSQNTRRSTRRRSCGAGRREAAGGGDDERAAAGRTPRTTPATCARASCWYHVGCGKSPGPEYQGKPHTRRCEWDGSRGHLRHARRAHTPRLRGEHRAQRTELCPVSWMHRGSAAGRIQDGLAHRIAVVARRYEAKRSGGAPPVWSRRSRRRGLERGRTARRRACARVSWLRPAASRCKTARVNGQL